MDHELLKRYLLDTNTIKTEGFIPRDLSLPDTDKIKVVIGPRRAGKTSLMKIKMNDLERSGVPRERMIYINLEDPRLYGMNHLDLMEVIDLHRQVFDHQDDDLRLFIDEPQIVPQWERTVRYFHEQGFDVTITGSSSRLLSREISTHLRGRSISFTLLPFNFTEYVGFREGELPSGKLNSRQRSRILTLVDGYLENGGFPELLKEKDREVITRTLSNYLDLLVLRDLIDRYSIRNTGLIRWFVKTLINSYSQRLSINKIANTIRSGGTDISKNTLYEYLSMLEDSMYIHVLRKFDFSPRKTRRSEGKLYVCDIALVRAIGIPISKGRDLENAVFLHLLQRSEPNRDLFYYTSSGKEVDFLLARAGRPEELIQVCFDISDPDTLKRETSSLIRAAKELNCRSLRIITYDQEKNISMDGMEIRIIPFWKYCLNRSKK